MVAKLRSLTPLKHTHACLIRKALGKPKGCSLFNREEDVLRRNKSRSLGLVILQDIKSGTSSYPAYHLGHSVMKPEWRCPSPIMTPVSSKDSSVRGSPHTARTHTIKARTLGKKVVPDKQINSWLVILAAVNLDDTYLCT